MNCDACQNQKATIFLSQLVGGKTVKVNLCKACAEERGVNDDTGYALADMLLGMGEETVRKSASASGELVCESCGYSQSDFKKTGRFGCADCYHVFDQGLDSLLEAMHRHTRHVGKTPATFPKLPLVATNAPAPPEMAASPLDKLSDLKLALSKSVEDEDYEEAARLRDAISQLESQMGDS